MLTKISEQKRGINGMVICMLKGFNLCNDDLLHNLLYKFHLMKRSLLELSSFSEFILSKITLFRHPTK